ncbi:hypothetical protein [Saccharopolyspora endophytica]|uniref:Uncharacterized protein n=1 Tax=Saccharopolyspora endophytica TaxID=543886 RepID=A0ABS5DQY7_9PSEU|nr:hypothetical protein [Saccharopolyspora endophytica]MBQ0928700.1 hypothetical protein [Saccharopolyspora endophytica]
MPRGLVEDHETWFVWCLGAWLLDGPGFHVDVEILETAARAMGEIAADQNASELAELCDGNAQTIGSDVMCEALVSFCETMSEGIDYLVDKAEDTGEGLSEAARTYREADHAAMQHLGGDPAAAAMDEHF